MIFLQLVENTLAGWGGALIKYAHVQENSLCSAYAGGSGPGLGC